MSHWTRRRALSASIAGVAGMWLPGCGEESPDQGTTTGSTGVTTGSGGSYPIPPCDTDAIVDSLLMEPKDAFVPLEKWLKAGASTDLLWAAALTVGARTVATETDLHSALVVKAGHLLSSRVAPDLALMPLFHAWYHQQVAVLALPTLGSPTLQPLDPADVPPPEKAEAALLAAFESWDAKAAEGAIVALYAAGGRDAVLGHLTRFGLRNQSWVGHTAIWTALALRGLDGFGWSCAPWILRSLARAITMHKADSSTGAFAANLVRLSSVPTTWRDGADDASAVPGLLDIFRAGDAEACVNVVIASLSSGLSPRTLWTALALAAVDQAVRWQDATYAVHELDTINALRYLQQITPDPGTELLALLQAAAWRPEFRAGLKGKVPVVAEGLDTLAPSSGAAPDLPTLFEALAGDRVEAARKLVAFFDAGGTPEEVIAAWPAVVVTHTGFDEHHYKFHMALLEETESMLPQWRRTLLLGITMRGPSSLDPVWERHADAQAIITALGK